MELGVGVGWVFKFGFACFAAMLSVLGLGLFTGWLLMLGMCWFDGIVVDVGG